jgi:nicotinate-nucleotide adenylyltransferase
VKPIYTKNRRIGLLGGSFNPAHEGHLHLSEEAIKYLKLDQLWWLVAPQNPLKKDTKNYEQRFASAQKIAAGHKKILVSDIEAREKTFYSIDTVAMLKRRFPGTRFIWLMGADNLAEFHRWKKWRVFLTQIPIVIFDRAPYSYTALASKTYLRMRRFLLKNKGIKRVLSPPGVAYIHMPRHNASSTALRKHLENAQF